MKLCTLIKKNMLIRMTPNTPGERLKKLSNQGTTWLLAQIEAEIFHLPSLTYPAGLSRALVVTLPLTYVPFSNIFAVSTLVRSQLVT